MQLMRWPNPIGWMYAQPEEIQSLVDRGWKVATEKERQDMIAAKHAKAQPAVEQDLEKALVKTFDNARTSRSKTL